MNKAKKVATWTGKAILTAIATCIFWPLGVFVGIALFFGMDAFESRP
jgi:hypothetical protein